MARRTRQRGGISTATVGADEATVDAIGDWHYWVPRCAPAFKINGKRAAFTTLLGSLCRLGRPADVPPLLPIRSLAYYQPVIAELLAHPVPDNYLEYLQRKLRRMAGEKTALADVQENTFSDDR